MTLRTILTALILTLPQSAQAETEADLSSSLVSKARTQVGVSTVYDPSDVQLSYPGGDIARERGVCTEVIIRALRDTTDVDLQQLAQLGSVL